MVSGLTVYDEGLRSGRWVGRYWNSTGVVKRDGLAETEMSSMQALPIDSFELALDGEDLAGGWKWIGATKEPIEGGHLVTIELASERKPVRLKVKTQLRGEPVMVRWLEITNTGGKSIGISRVSPWSGLLWNTPFYQERLLKDNDDAPFEVAYTGSQEQLQEGSWRFEPFGEGSKVISGTRGKSGWGHPTFFARNRGTGEWFAGSLAWSGNWNIRLNAAQDKSRNRASFSFEMGPASADPVLRLISPGETVRTPQTHLLCMRGDLDQVVQAMHEHVRSYVFLSPVASREHQIEANHRGYIVDHEDEAGLKREIDIAADIGAEMFVVDAGWFGPQPNRWYLNAGDWYAGQWLPNDLTPVREYARSKGLLFGLWVELEAAGPVTRVRKEHPDWIMSRNGEPLAGGRQLDFSKPQAAGWAEAEVARLIQKYDLDMFRIDYNMTVNEGGNQVVNGVVENTLWRHVEALYGIFDRIHRRFPRVILQNCASGGGRLDYGMLARFHNTELSDFLRAPRTLKIFNGMTWVLPPEYLLRTFGTETGGMEADGNLDLQLNQALMARPIFRGIAPTLDEFDPLLRTRIRESVAQFKSVIRPLMIGSRVYHHTPVLPMLSASPWLVIEYAARDRLRGAAWLFRTAQSGDPEFAFRPRGLDASRLYQVQLGKAGSKVSVTGDVLINRGITVRLESNLTSEMLLFNAVD